MLERISRREEFDLFIAWIAISLAFTIIFISPGGLLTPAMRIPPLAALIFFGVSLVTVGIGFILHEMAHKFLAMKYGFWAEFRKDNVMLLIAVVLAALVGFVFAAPGATVIYPNSADGRGLSREENGKISAAGPLVNLLLCIPFALILYLAVSADSPNSILTIIGTVGLQVNAMVAAFNMLPVSVLDGKKILAWNVGVFAVMIVAAFGILIGSFSFLP
ncbi:MAG: peptidase M50 [Methanoregula sp.]|nr:peptidase M50 [Methanoregula sp.]